MRVFGVVGGVLSQTPPTRLRTGRRGPAPRIQRPPRPTQPALQQPQPPLLVRCLRVELRRRSGGRWARGGREAQRTGRSGAGRLHRSGERRRSSARRG